VSPRARRKTTAQHHVEWLQLVDVSGPFISLGVLSETFPQNLDAVDPELAERYRQAHAEWLANREERRPDPAIDTAFVDFVLGEVLEFPAEFLADRQELGDTYSTTLAEHRVTLRPDLAVRRPGETPTLLISRYTTGVALDKPLDERGLHASPAERMRMLLSRLDGVRSGLVTNGAEWLLVHAPPERTATFVTWYGNLLAEEQITLRAFRSLLGAHRLFGVEEAATLDGLFERSRDDEREVTDQLGFQARHAVELLVAAFDRADRDVNGALLREVPEYRLYEATLSVVMRIIFLLAAEARGLFPDDGPWAESYAVTPLRTQLESEADRQGIEVLERRFDAWPRLLATFRAIHGGVEHSRVRMPGYGGGLFDPARYPFLEGAHGPLPRISNRHVLHILDALQTLDVEVPGGRERRPLSFRALGVEQIGHVYEGLLDHTAIRADAPALGLTGTTKKEPEIPLAELEERRDEGEDSLLDLLVEETGRSRPALRKALAVESEPERVARLRAVCDHDAVLIHRVLPFFGLVRDDVFGDPVIFREGFVYVTLSSFRRSTGTHYTPPSLTEPIVQYALEPLVYEGPEEGSSAAEWQLKRPRELLELKVCDIAMGSAAFLVAACRYLGVRLTEAWELYPDEAPSDAGSNPEEREMTARRLVAERCLYGVDVSPLAVEIAKVSMWLTTLRRDRPFTFLDHALRCGDSLLGVTSLQQVEELRLRPEKAGSVLLHQAREVIRTTMDDVRQVRERIERTDAIDLREVEAKTVALARADRATRALTVIGDLIIGSAFEEVAGASDAESVIEAAAEEIGRALGGSGIEQQAAALAQLETRAGDALLRGRSPGSPDSPKPFHWALEFPEVFSAGRCGFDAVVGNPPFLAGKRISSRLGGHYSQYLHMALSHHKAGAADLGAYFLLRASSLLASRSYLALIETNTISQGATREIGLAHLLKQRWVLIRAVVDANWPGEAGVTISPLVLTRRWGSQVRLNDVAVEHISSFLDSEISLADPVRLPGNKGLASTGTGLGGDGFIIQPDVFERFVGADPRNSEVLKRFLTSRDLNNTIGQEPTRYAIDFGTREYDEASTYTFPFAHVTTHVRPYRESLDKQIHEHRYWLHWDKREDFYRRIRALKRVIVCGRVSKHHIFSFADPAWLFSDGVVMFASDAASLFAVLQSVIHEVWIHRYQTTMRTDPRYSVSRCFLTFPIAKECQRLDEIGARYAAVRKGLAEELACGLTAIYNRYHDSACDDPRIDEIRELQKECDQRTLEAYGWEDIQLTYEFRGERPDERYAISTSSRSEILSRLLELNLRNEGREHTGDRVSAERANPTPMRSRRTHKEQMEL
jgi:hypothetical protein